MDILTSVPVRVSGPESIAPLVEAVTDRIRRRAYENFVQRGSLPGHHLEDWLDAQRELTIGPLPAIQVGHEDIFVEMVLPEIDLLNLSVPIAPRQLVIASDPDEDGLQVYQVIELPVEISLDGVDAEQLRNLLRITAAVAQSAV